MSDGNAFGASFGQQAHEFSSPPLPSCAECVIMLRFPAHELLLEGGGSSQIHSYGSQVYPPTQPEFVMQSGMVGKH